MALKEFFAVDAVGRADDRARTALEVADHPFADRLEILRKIELGDALAVAGIGPQLLVGLRDHYAHDLGCLARRRLRTRRRCLAVTLARSGLRDVSLGWHFR